MSGSSEPLGETDDGAAERRLGGLSKIEEELRFHLELMTEKLCAEGFDRTDAEAEARRRFGDVDRVAAECAGPIGRALTGMVAATTSIWFGALLAIAVWACGNLPIALLIHMSVALAAGTCAALAAVWPETSGVALRAGRFYLGLLCLLALESFFLSHGDWVHSLWSIQFPLYGLLFGSGLILIQVWPEDRRQQPSLSRGWNGATIAFVTVVALGAMPLLLTVLPFDVRPLARENVPLSATFLEVALYGFGGEVPESMSTEGIVPGRGAFGGDYQLDRGLGIPPRIVTVTMASSLLAAVHWILFAALALAGRMIQVSKRRRVFLLVTPMIVALAALSPVVLDSGGNMDRALYRGIWKNEPWLVGAYGPTLLIAAIAAAALCLAVRRASGQEQG